MYGLVCSAECAVPRLAGALQKTLNKHTAPIFSLKWNRKGNLLLSGSVDKTAIIWDTKSGDMKQEFQFHNGGTLEAHCAAFSWLFCAHRLSARE